LVDHLEQGLVRGQVGTVVTPSESEQDHGAINSLTNDQRDPISPRGDDCRPCAGRATPGV
jgi:hypothetical protein